MLFPLMAVFIILSLPLPAHAVTRKIEIEGSAPPREREIKPPRNTTVITKKGAPSSSAAPVPGDICPSLEGAYYCSAVGKEAWLRETGEPLGRVAGLAWRSRGQAMGLYLSPGAEAAAPSKNIPSPADSFYYIIDSDRGMVFVEPYRIIVRE